MLERWYVDIMICGFADNKTFEDIKRPVRPKREGRRMRIRKREYKRKMRRDCLRMMVRRMRRGSGRRLRVKRSSLMVQRRKEKEMIGGMS